MHTLKHTSKFVIAVNSITVRYSPKEDIPCPRQMNQCTTFQQLYIYVYLSYIFPNYM